MFSSSTSANLAGSSFARSSPRLFFFSSQWALAAARLWFPSPIAKTICPFSVYRAAIFSSSSLALSPSTLFPLIVVRNDISGCVVYEYDYMRDLKRRIPPYAYSRRKTGFYGSFRRSYRRIGALAPVVSLQIQKTQKTFSDFPAAESPLSIHKAVLKLGKYTGVQIRVHRHIDSDCFSADVCKAEICLRYYKLVSGRVFSCDLLYIFPIRNIRRELITGDDCPFVKVSLRYEYISSSEYPVRRLHHEHLLQYPLISVDTVFAFGIK